jgi:hypothetical protein
LRLAAAVEIDERQPAVGKARSGRHVHAVAIWSAVTLPIVHAVEQGLVDWT